jgi:hypothetical protein
MSTRSTPYLTSAAGQTTSTLNSDDSIIDARNTYLENCGAKLTEAAYPVMLRHGAVDNWLDLKLELWKILTEIVKKGKQDRPSSGVRAVGL